MTYIISNDNTQVMTAHSVNNELSTDQFQSFFIV